VKAFVRVDDKKELINPPRFQEKEIKELMETGNRELAKTERPVPGRSREATAA
jgi:hypothetical protein